MDQSGGSGQPRPGTDEPAGPHTAPATPSPGQTDAQPTDARRTTTTRDAAKGDPSMGDSTPTTDTGTTPADSAPNAHRDEHGHPRRDTTPEDGPAPQEHPGRPAAPQSDDASPAHRPAQPDTDRPTPTNDTDAADATDAGQAAPDEPAGRPTAPHTPADHPTAPDAGHRAAHGAGTAPGHMSHPDRTLAHSGAKNPPPQRRESPRGGLLMGRPFGVPVYVAPSWFLVAALITWVFGGQLDRVLPELGAARYLVSLFFAVAFYASVLVHELAHTVAALRFKLPVRRIQLQFFGGVSEIEKEAETPGREFVLAFVGPLLSLVLAGIFYVAMQPVEPGTVPGVLLAGLMISNLIVAAFNLLPGLPLDGGRMLRAVVWKITGKPMNGTVAAAWVGRALAVSVLIGLPLLTQSGALGSTAEDSVGMDTVTDALLAAILAAIIWTGAGNSLRMARLREHLPELRARNLTRRAVPVETDTPLSEALRRANAAGARALVVVDADGTPLSLVREAAIVGVPEHRRPWVAVSGLAQELTDGMRVSAELAGEDLLDVLRATPATEYLVVEETGEIYGVLSAADVERAFVKAMARPS
ncbi:site-2 protease family protein [Streptomyces panaciradicis]|uniref:site-2 protease family protein n=1 Tax=Streptomyces panaciradicis TaxID=1470261 RepID=UPI00201CB2D4|nr:site-2 protease family protein [Streptomyces panaciradicis]MCL6669381.1 site-2 protease family protein [Streptomyces panaciradicis]